MSSKPIVVGVDGSPASVRAAALGWQLARAAAARCRLVHALPDVVMADPLAPVVTCSPDLIGHLVADARAQLGASLSGAVPGDALAELEILIGRAPLVLREVARAEGAQLVVVGGKRHGPLARNLGGSTAHDLVRALAVPVLVAGPAGRPRGRVLAAVDLSPIGSATLAAAWRIARLRGARLRVVHVVEPFKLPMVVAEPAEGESSLRRSETQLGELAAGLGIAEAELITRPGIADEVIEAEATDWGADLLVVGSHGKGWVDRLLLGSTTERLLDALPTSLLVIPAAPVGARDGARRAREPSPATATAHAQGEREGWL